LQSKSGKKVGTKDILNFFSFLFHDILCNIIYKNKNHTGNSTNENKNKNYAMQLQHNKQQNFKSKQKTAPM